ncbi:hypothetical protein [Collimonas fungivorans]|uniref:hypothetical protein n=1 Tax=Collimonas fungivorans TaxID=158899 RepID=UPI003FA37A90
MSKNNNFANDEEDQRQIRTPSMSRSRNQLAAAYAPGSFFTFEGGLGACISIPDQSPTVDEAQISEPTREQIMLRLREAWQSWFTRAYDLNTGERHIEARQCIDEMLLRENTLSPLGASHISFVNPLKMGYAPAPLTFVCNTCGMFKGYDSVAEVAKDQHTFKPDNCPGPTKLKRCKWRQLDVIFVHWSGEWMPATPGMWEWSTKTSDKALVGKQCASCGSRDFILRTDSPRIGEWGFECASCGHRERASWLQNDPFTTEVFRENGGRRVGERRMEPISYRASSAFYAQAEQFIIFSERDQNLLGLLAEQNEQALGSFVAGKYGFGGAEPTSDEMKTILLQGGHDTEWESHESISGMLDLAQKLGDTKMASTIQMEQRKLIRRWLDSDPPLIPVKNELPATLKSLIQRRSEFSSRYDPFVLAVEHEALMRSKVSRTSADGARAPFVRFYRLDQDLAPKNEQDKKAQEDKTLDLMDKLGLAELGLIREFELCRFTHGYSRVNPSPVMEKRGQMVPVRLRLFELLKNNKRPVYVVNQANEAIHVSLRPENVYTWLKAVGVTDLPDWDPNGTVKLGGRILETAEPFGRYFSHLHPGDASTYRYVYTLLHSYAHLFMKAVAEFSGLDLGSLGEYLFPADLSFVIYRNGTTMDLGNLSSLWRNENNRFLAHLLEPASHRCNSGSLCDFGGGACPDCIMVPETSCVAQNQLLSRAVLRGGLSPREDLTHKDQRIPGFLEVVNGSNI